MGDMEMDAQATELQDAENNLKQLMADLTRATARAQEAVAKIASKTAIAAALRAPHRACGPAQWPLCSFQAAPCARLAAWSGKTRAVLAGSVQSPPPLQSRLISARSLSRST